MLVMAAKKLCFSSTIVSVASCPAEDPASAVEGEVSLVFDRLLLPPPLASSVQFSSSPEIPDNGTSQACVLPASFDLPPAS